MIDRFKYILSLIRNGPSFMGDFNELLMDRYLGHHKVIGWHEGSPVYSSFLIPGMSKPHANSLVQRFMSHLKNEPLPAMVNISVTDTCNAKCEHCSFFGAMNQPGRKVLSTNEMKDVIKNCQDFGLSIINFVGGEPLIRKDLPDLIQYIDKNRSVSSVFTNGWYLPERAYELKKAGTMLVNVSLDSTEPSVHDSFRRLPGLFEKAIEGIRTSRKHKLLTGISTTVTQQDLEQGNLERMIRLAHNEGVNELFVFDMMPVGMYSHRDDLKATPPERKLMYQIIDDHNKKKDLPGIFCYTRFKDPSIMGCSAGRNYFYITPYGDVCPCDFTAKPVGNLTQTPIYNLWSKLVNQRRHCGFVNDLCNLDTRTEMTPLQKNKPNQI